MRQAERMWNFECISYSRDWAAHILLPGYSPFRAFIHHSVRHSSFHSEFRIPHSAFSSALFAARPVTFTERGPRRAQPRRYVRDTDAAMGLITSFTPACLG
jgi:hypothetical protein